MKDFANFGDHAGEEGKTMQQWEEEARSLAASFHGKSEGDLLRAIYARAVEGRRSGTLTDEQIDAFYAQFSSMLDPVRRKKLKKIVEQLKRM